MNFMHTRVYIGCVHLCGTTYPMHLFLFSGFSSLIMYDDEVEKDLDLQETLILNKLKLNPICRKTNKRLKCYICDSIFHVILKCPLNPHGSNFSSMTNEENKRRLRFASSLNFSN